MKHIEKGIQAKKIKTLGFVKSNLAYVPKTGLKEKVAVNSCGLYQGKKLARKQGRISILAPRDSCV